jgi:AraC-like DNA-binding protein
MIEQEIYIGDIQPLSSALSFIQKTDKSEVTSPIMSGQFRFNTFQNGLTTHATDAVEEQDANISAELPSGISFNFLFSGVIDYSFGSKKYCLRKKKEQTAQGSIIVNNADEILTRHLSAGMHIRKLNIFVEKQWLTSRCQTEADHRVIAEIFQQSNVYLWQPGENAIAKAEALIKLNNENTFSQKLTSEHLTMELLAICLDEVYRQVKNENGENGIVIENTRLSLKARLDTCLGSKYSLVEIAQQLNISVSTLQRQFKRNYNMNISTYIKQRRMDIAKKSLLLGDLSIGEVAFHAGYNHTSNFINAFKNSFSITPAAYVKLHKIR